MGRKATFFTFTITAAMVFGSVAEGLPGELDDRFGTDGFTRVKLDTERASTAEAIVIDDEGRAIVAGFVGDYYNNDELSDFALARFTTQGGLDETFGDGGIVIADLGTKYDEVSSIVIDSQGRIVVAGSIGDPLLSTRTGDEDRKEIAVARFLDDGSLDTTFGEADGSTSRKGWMTHAFTPVSGTEGTGSYGDQHLNAVAVDGDDRILLAGYIIGANGDVLIARLTEEGQVDSTFSDDGVVIVNEGGSNSEYGMDIAFSNGNVFVAAQTGSFSARKFAVIQLEEDGSPVADFGDSSGLLNFGDANASFVQSISIDNLGRIILAGYTRATSGDDYDIAVVRLTSSGAPDGSFGETNALSASGSLIRDIDGDDDVAVDVTIDSENRILIAGSSDLADPTTVVRMLVMRFTESGQPDSSFGVSGIMTAQFMDGTRNDGRSIAVSSTGLILVAVDHFVSLNNSFWGFGIARVIPSNVPGVPTGVTLESGAGELVVSWTAPADDGGSDVTGYVASTSTGATCTTATTSCTISGLENGTQYSVTVLAENVSGESQASAAAVGTPLAVPSAPTEVMVESGAGELVVSWTAPADDGGSDVTGYVASTSTGATCSTATTSCTISGLDNDVAYLVTVLAQNAVGNSESSSPAQGTPVSPGSFAPLSPKRLLDTRSGDKVGEVDGSGDAYSLQVTGGNGVPSDGVAAVALNVTVVDGEAGDFGGFVTVYPCGTRPDASNLNFTSGQTIPNSVIAPVSDDGKVCFYVYGKAHLLADVSGYFSSGFAPLSPKRLLDTRSGDKVGEVDGSGDAYSLQVTGGNGVPSDGVAAVALNVTVVDGEAGDFGGFVTVYPCGTRPDASNLNFTSGQTIPNSVIAPVSDDGKVCFYVYGKAHLLADVSGYFSSGFAPLSPKRLLDTRSGDKVGEVDGSGDAYSLQVTGGNGVPSDGVAAVALNVTVVDGEAGDFGGFVTVYPCGTRPDASNLNFTSGQTIPNSVIAPVSDDGKVCFYVYGKAHLLADVSGYFIQ